MNDMDRNTFYYIMLNRSKQMFKKDITYFNSIHIKEINLEP